jgi:hypothetical protein
MSVKDTVLKYRSSFKNNQGKNEDAKEFFARVLIATLTIGITPLFLWTVYSNSETLKSNLAFIDINRALNDYQPLSISDIRQQMSPQSAEITRQFGGGNMVIILPSDPKSDFFLVNYPNKLDDQFNYPSHGSGGTTTKEIQYLNNPMGRYFLDFTIKDWNLLIDRSYMFSGGATANVNRSGFDDDQSVAFLRPESPVDFTAYSQRVPYSTTLQELNQWGFFHEMTHAHDKAIHTRNYLDTTKKYGMDIDEDTGQLIAESNADVGAALITLRVTENMDTFKSLIRPMRFLNAKDKIHSTQHVSAAVLKGVFLEDVKHRTDIELMSLAEQLVDLYVVQEVKKYQEVNCWLSSTSLLDHLLNKKAGMLYYRTDMMNESSSAIEASLQNLLYQGKLSEHLPALSTSILWHIFKFFDYTMLRAYWKATQSSVFTKEASLHPEVFAKEMNFEIDYSSQERKDQNSKKLHDYYIGVTSDRLGFDQKGIISSRLKKEKSSVR